MSNLPTLQELVDNLDIYEKQDKLNFLLNQDPPAKWIKTHPYIKGHRYIPIDKIEYLLRKIFKKYKIEILREGTSFNGVYVVARIHYIDLVTGKWHFHDGIGAVQLQTKKGASPADLANINNGAISMAYPLAKTLAIKDAADMFGKLFGSDLNRRDTLPAKMDIMNIEENNKNEEIDRISKFVEKANTIDELRSLKLGIPSEHSDFFIPIIDKKIKSLENKK